MEQHRRSGKVASRRFWLYVLILLLGILVFGGALWGPGRPVYKPMASPREVPPFGADPLGRPFGQVLFVALSRTLRVTLSALLLGAGLGWALGMGSALTRSFAGVGSALNLFFSSLPPVYVALLAAAFATRLGSIEVWLVITLALLETQRAYRAASRTAGTVIVQPFTTAALAIGADRFHLVKRYLFPEIVRQWLPIMPLELSELIALEATVSFLGLGGGAAYPTLGRLIADGRHQLYGASHLFWFPVTILVATIGLLIYWGFAPGRQETGDERGQGTAMSYGH